MNALQASNILDTIKKEKFNLTTTIGAGTLVNQGQMENGVWFWKFQYPVRMRLVGQTSTRPEQAFTFEITVRRVDPASNPAAWKSARWFPVTPQQESETHIMHIHHLIGALLLCAALSQLQITRAGKMHEARRRGKTAQATGNTRQAVPRQPHNSRETCRLPALLLYRKAHRWILP
ncbi:Macrophage killing protein with similarity to conjugation protein [Escherichia coli]|uniref:Macrophage killing protein with similarity to conjugation protein n=1 Tax=Escherichia coli TaxID=562 RepID=A0A2X1LFF1_ECOLX|nr:Macrophage killing protein with similarity to conjugation protein [Escherichia coli]